MLQFRVLGPLEVWDGDRPLQLGGTKRRALLALLILNANEVLRTERLAEELWGDHPPGNAVAAIHNHVSRLRKELGRDALCTHRCGYVLRTDPDSIDLTCFEQLLTQAEALPAAERANRLAEALALWRGGALADLVLEDAVAHQIARLEERRLVALERRIDADLETGKDAELVPELEALVDKDPLREHFRWQLILALYRSGRQAAALEAYRETRRLLSDELGLEPGPELRTLEGAILRHDPALAAPPREVEARPPTDRTRRRRTSVAVGAVVGLATLALVAYALAGGAKPNEVADPPAGAGAALSPVSWQPSVPSKTLAGGRSHPNLSGDVAARTRGSMQLAKNVAHQAGGRTSTRNRGRSQSRTRASGKPSPPPTRTPPPPPPHPPPQPAPPPPTPPGPPTLADRAAWWKATSQPELGVSQTGVGVTISIPANADDGFNAGIGTRCKAVGDFDARVAYQLLQWPGADGLWVSLLAGDLGGVNTYRSDSFGDTYGAYVPPSGGTTVLSHDTEGVLRLARRGDTITGSFLAGADWTTIFSGTGSTAETSIILTVFNLADVEPFAARPASVRFSAFTLTADSLDC